MKYYSGNLARTPIKTYKDDEKWPLFVNKQLFWWSASITLDNNNAVLTDLQAFFSLNTVPHNSVSLTICISSFEYFDPYDHYTACWVTLNISDLDCMERYSALYHVKGLQALGEGPAMNSFFF